VVLQRFALAHLGQPLKLVIGQRVDDLVIRLPRPKSDQRIGAKLTFIDQPGCEPFEREVKLVRKSRHFHL
jgi:hypothetical protein